MLNNELEELETIITRLYEESAEKSHLEIDKHSNYLALGYWNGRSNALSEILCYIRSLKEDINERS